MDRGVANDAVSMEPELIKTYTQILLNKVFTQKLEENEERTKTITEYMNRHKKVIEGLEVYPLSLSENCLVPIGKRAFMKGKLTHTNEILASLGDGYFAKYSASQAIALCNRRIAWADEMLKGLETERNLYEMRQYLPLEHGAFGEKDTKDIVEHWTENKLDEWRAQHRQHEKAYHQKLAREKTDISTEEDLLKRLDELEIQEELEDEINRLEAEQKEFYGDDLEEGEVYDESEEDTSDSDQVTTELIQEELKKLKDIQMGRITSGASNISSGAAQDEIPDTNTTRNEESHDSSNSIQDTLRESCSPEPREVSKETNGKSERRISFAEPCVVEYEGNAEEACSASNVDDAHEDSEDEDDIIRIEFSHSSHIPDILEPNNAEIQSPVDIYKLFNTPKSILKRSPNDTIYNQVAPPLNEDSSTETEDEDVEYPVFSSIIKEKVQERNISPANDVSIKKDEKRIASRFKLERAARRK
ncbi:PREDICTED: RNA polymerase II subunit 5-mediating protein homolog [Vollenhovia emeryi]|uniref:RNA polymerase II subunit 5-mediating protein homolog n=1 Tax=Vollenhovia emeryi TaxID=411798 RepID=UPI0005F51442|nr:PREDICTED: RNA polymerase II subunit 5-mediating protein homolog [Vollenhovia emeryi]